MLEFVIKLKELIVKFEIGLLILVMIIELLCFSVYTSFLPRI